MLSLAALLATVNSQAGCLDAYCKLGPFGRRRQDIAEGEMPRLDLRKVYSPVAEEEERIPERDAAPEAMPYVRTEGPYGKLDMPAVMHLDEDGFLRPEDTIGDVAPVCPDMSPKWATNAAHATHMITVEDLQHYFNPRTTWENTVMTVMHESTKIVEHAPEHRFPRGAPFRSPLLNKLAYHMEQKEKHRGLPGDVNAFHVMVHTLHTHEVMLMIKERYHKVSPSKMTCACIERNMHSIRKELLAIAEYFANKELRKLEKMFERADEWHVAANTLEQVRRDLVFMEKTHGFANDAAIYLKCKLHRF